MTTITLTVTPFRNDQEVRRLIELAYSNTTEDKREAIGKINELEARVSQLPMGLGSLQHILKAEIIQAEQREQNKIDDNSSLQYACAVAVLKFVDAVSVPYRAYHSRLSYRNIAKQVDLPGHIISLRHDIAHRHELPSLHDLLAAVDFSKKWLRKNCLDELVETMALFSQGSYGELLDIIARETVQAFVDARLNFLIKRSKKRLNIVDERVEEIRKALQMSNGKEMMAEVFIRCGNILMLPNQLSRLNYDPESPDLLPACVIQFWKPILQMIITDSNFISLIIKKIFVYLNEICALPSSNPSVIDRQRIGWIFYFVNQSSIQLDHCSIFLQFVRILQPWFTQSLSQMVLQMVDTRPALISQEKADQLLTTISLFANPLDNLDEDDQTTTNFSFDILPRNQLNKAELIMFKKREILAEVPVGLLNEEDEQNLEMDIDLSKTDRNFLGCINRQKPIHSLPSKRKRASSPSIDMNFFHDQLYSRHSYRY